MTIAASALFLAIVPWIAHRQFSAFGFNPTDDGFFLAFSRRLIEGEIPHRDFITVRPAGSALLHLPFVLWGGDEVFMISRRFVWLQFAWIALAWVRVTAALCGLGRRPFFEILVAAIAFALCSHYFPIMAWATIDGLFLSASGLMLCRHRHPVVRAIGYCMVGSAYLCKQNFVALAVAAVLLLGDRRRPFAWFAVATPAIAYVGVIALAGALPEALEQLTTQTDLASTGLFKYLWEFATGWGVAAGFVAMRLAYRRFAAGAGANAAGVEWLIASLGILAIVAAASHSMAEGRYLDAPSFGLFGMALGALLHFVIDGARTERIIQAGVLTVVAAWCASVSVGYNTPALASGLCAAYLLILLGAAPLPGTSRPAALAFIVALAASAVVVLVNFNAARQRYVYLDRPASELVFPLDGVLAGGAGIVTARNTHSLLVDLNAAIAAVPDHRYSIVPEFAAHWVKAREVNPLPIDWSQPVDLGRAELVRRVTDALDAQRGSSTVIVPKFQSAALARGFVPMPESDRYTIARHVRRNFTKIGETQFFELYR